MSDRFAEFRGLSFVPSRIPVTDALVAFIPHGQPIRPAVQEALDRAGSSRWYPAAGGHELHIPYEGGPYDRAHFKVRPKAWDHETCSSCAKRLPPTTSCWVTEDGPFTLLCGACKAQMDAESEEGPG